jgi:hypothetical protein
MDLMRKEFAVHRGCCAMAGQRPKRGGNGGCAGDIQNCCILYTESCPAFHRR